MKLVEATKDDEGSLNAYLYRKMGKGRIQKVKLVWDSPSKRSGDCWEALAIKFTSKMTKEALIQAIVDLKADEYWGMQDGYHIFWFD